MKTKYLTFFILFIIISINSNLKADVIFFDSKNIKIEKEGNIIFALHGKAKIPDENILVKGDKSIYNKEISELVIVGNVKFFDDLNNIYIESEEAIFKESENTLLAKGITLIEIQDKYQVFSENVFYDRNSLEISSNLGTSVLDNKNNIFIFEEGFLLETVDEILSSKKTNILDSDRNNYIFEMAKINLKTNEIVGKEIQIDFIDTFFGNENNDPMLKGKSTISDDKKTTINKAVFSTCNVENKRCRGWELQSEKFVHNKVEKLFEYNNSWLKVFDQKVFFFPYFSHPDPSVKRTSGFLSPVYSSSDNLGRSVNIPYFYVISDSKDMTFNPRIYSDNDFILQSEYRQAYENSNLIADFSYNNDNDNTNTHTFIDLRGQFNDKLNYSMEFQNVTNDNYLKIHDLKSIADTNILMSRVDTSTLTSYFKIENEIDEYTQLDTSIRMYEDLSVNSDNDKYQYIFPDFSFNKNIELDESYNGNFDFSSSGYQKNYNTNVYEAQVNNDFKFSSFDSFTKKGIVSNYNLLLKNYNTYSENSSVFDENNDHELFGTLLLNTELPLKEKLSNSTNYLKPKLQFKFSPTNGKDISSDTVRLSYENLFSQNRIGRSDMVEEHASATIGLEFEKQNLLNEKILGFNIGNIFKNKKNSSMPSKSKLDQTRSDIVGNFFYEPNESFKFEYNFSYDRDLDFSNYESISAKFGKNKLITNFDYLSEDNEFGSEELITNNTKLKFTNEHSLSFNTTKDLKNDFTQFYKFSYEYETDCLSASLQYQKKFFRDGNLVPDESLYFLIRFIPFTEIQGSANTVFEY